MKCQKAQSLMLDSLYAVLAPRQQRALEKHLASCPACSKEFAEQKNVISVFRDVDFEKPSAALNEIVRQMAVRELEQEALFAGRRSVTYWKPALASAAAALLVIVGVVYYLPQAQKEQTIAQYPPAESVAAPKADFTGAADGFKLKEDKMDVARDVRLESQLQPEAPVSAGIAPEKRKDLAPMHLALESTDELSGAETTSGANASNFRTREEGLLDSRPEVEIDSLRRTQKGEKLQKTNVASPSLAPDSATLGEETAGKKSLSNGDRHPVSLKYHEATESYQDAVRFAPAPKATVDAQFRLGQSYQAEKEYDRALVEYKSIMEKHPEYSSLGFVYLAAGDSYLALGRAAEAIQMYETVRDRFPELRAVALERLSSATAPAQAPAGPEQTSGEAR
ncbi:MAG: hypothetical protein C4520_17355 [Candidatus Abyssobacteria bacterium SURF_5]|uniref:Putative zinc-finger domain-containing protein n=1 Tax=Abyssobacteria bacterium (strain SURF_5) TaxID=2093360 RepID=A0A3A4NEH2_ABYX5|nr:MAG: hypothetical protein C4520_17355 [Candidatus Abyssubacteria bacterium SURF_5]